MISNYAPPQTTIRQYLARLTGGTPRRLVAGAVAPRYLLSRYGKETTAGTTFGAALAEQDLPYTWVDDAGATQSLPEGHVVDQSFNRLYGVGLEASLCTFGSGKFAIDSSLEPNVIRLSDSGNLLNQSTGAGGTLATALRGRGVSIGDIALVTIDSITVRRSVVGFRGQAIGASTGSNTGKDDGLAAASLGNPPAVADAELESWSLNLDSGAVVGANGVAIDGTPTLTAKEGMLFDGRYYDFYTCTVAVKDTSTGSFTIETASGRTLGTCTWEADGSTVTGDTKFTIQEGTEDIEILIDVPFDQFAVNDVLQVKIYPPYSTPVLPVIAGTYTGAVDNTYFIEVVDAPTAATSAAGMVVRVYDTAGLLTAAEVTVAANNTLYTLGQGLQFKYNVTGAADGSGLLPGVRHYIHAVAATASATKFDALVLSGPANGADVSQSWLGDIDAVEFRLPYTGIIPALREEVVETWTSADDAVTVNAGLSLEVASRSEGYQWCPFVNDVGLLHLYWRALVPLETGGTGRTLCTTESEILEAAGANDPDNDLGFLARTVFSGAQGLPVWVLPVSDDTLDGYSEALTRLEGTTDVYSLACGSDDATVKAAFRDHVENMSAPTIKLFRKAYCGTDSPGQHVVMSTDSSGMPFTATLTAYGSLGNLLVTFPSSEALLTSRNLRAGDYVRLHSTGVLYTIAAVISDTELRLSAGPAQAVTPAARVVVEKADTAANTVDYVRTASLALASRRVANVWSDRPTRVNSAGTTETVSCRFLAGEVAGLRSSLPSWIGLSRQQITTVSAAPLMFTRFSQAQLNDIAAVGTMLVTQDASAGTVYLRHQLTTQTTDGPLYYEDSITANLDELSFGVKDIIEKYVGSHNASEDTAERLRIELFTYFRSKQAPDAVYGSQLLSFANLSVTVHPTFADRLVVTVTLRLPLPVNYVDVTLTAEAGFAAAA